MRLLIQLSVRFRSLGFTIKENWNVPIRVTKNLVKFNRNGIQLIVDVQDDETLDVVEEKH